MAGMKIKKHDTVKVISGKDKDKQGKVLKVLASTNQVLVEGRNLVKKHQRPTQQDQTGGILEKEMSIHVSNVMLVAAKGGEPVKVARRDVDGKRQRVDKKSGKPVD
jgi:large subunit ribosomal protein L24